MNYWLIIRLPILFAIGVSDGVYRGERGAVVGWSWSEHARRVPSHLPACLLCR